ncbi:MAG: MFS transporter [Deltaproteobacteria bacterium]|nr:MFS transporter [Deltaproteobacteria bacterium]
MDLSTRQASEPHTPAGFTNWLRGFVPVRRSEALTVLLLSLNVFVLLTTYYLLKVVREPLILLGGGAELKAYASAGQTLLLLAIVPAFGWLASRVSRLRLMTTMQLIFMGCLVGFYALSQAKAPIGLAFYLWVGIFNVLVVSNFWSFANDLYTEEEGKRLFAVIGVGASLGAIVGAFAPRVLYDALGVGGLMMVALGGLGLSIVLYRIIDIRERDRKARVRSERAAKAAAKPVDTKGGFAMVMHDRYLRLLAVMLLIATIINTSGEYVMSKMATDAAEQLGSDEAKGEYLNAFFSSYYTIVNIVSALLQALIVTRLLTKLGVRRSLFIMPLVVLGGWLALIMFVNLTTVRVVKTVENSLDYSLHNTLRHALFLPTSRDAKFKAKAAIDTFVFRMGDVIAGIGIVALFVEVFGFGIRAFAILNVCLAVCWLLVARLAGRLHDKLVAEAREDDGPR